MAVAMCAALLAVPAVLAADNERVALEDFESGLGPRWTFANGPEFPGAKGEFTVTEAAAHSGSGGGRLVHDFSGGGAYVQATLKLPDTPSLGGVEFWVRKPGPNQMTVRVVDEQGQTFQKSFSMESTAWQKVRVTFAPWPAHWGGPDDGAFHGRATQFGILVEQGPSGAVDIDDLAGIPAGRSTSPTLLVRYRVVEFGDNDGWAFLALGKQGESRRRGSRLSYDFRSGATGVGVHTDLALYGSPDRVFLRLRSDGSRNEVQVSLYSHFQTFYRTAGMLTTAGEQTLSVPLGDMADWHHEGGENDGIVRYPLRVGRIVVTRAGGGTPAGEVGLLDLAVRTTLDAREAMFPLARWVQGPGQPGFEISVASLAPEATSADVSITYRDFEGRVLGEAAHKVGVGFGGPPPPLRVAPPATEPPYLEAQFAVSAPGQRVARVTASRVLPWADPGSAEPDRASPWGMGVYLYRYARSPEGYAEMDRAAALAQAAGVKWSREELGWAGLEPEKGRFDWEFYDRVVDTAARHGITIYGLLDYWSAWTKPFTAEGIDDYCAYCRATVTHYKGRIKHWEIWNEPNIFFWDGPKEVYFELLKRAYATIKEVDPEATVFGCSTAGVDTGFISRAMAAGAPFDGITIHPYRGRIEDREFVKEMRGVAAMERPAGAPNPTGKGPPWPVWITEMGWSTEVGATSERDQAGLLARCYLGAVGSGAIGSVSWYDFREDGVNPYYNEHHFGVIRQDLSLKPAYRAAATVCRTLAGLKPVGVEDWGPDVLACRFAEGDREVVVFWTTGRPRLVALSGPDVRVLNLMGEDLRCPTVAGKRLVALAPNAPVFACAVRRGITGAALPLSVSVAGGAIGPGGTVQLTGTGADSLPPDAVATLANPPLGVSVSEVRPWTWDVRVDEATAPGTYVLPVVIRVGGSELLLAIPLVVAPDVIEV